MINIYVNLKAVKNTEKRLKGHVLTFKYLNDVEKINQEELEQFILNFIHENYNTIEKVKYAVRKLKVFTTKEFEITTWDEVLTGSFFTEIEKANEEFIPEEVE